MFKMFTLLVLWVSFCKWTYFLLVPKLSNPRFLEIISEISDLDAFSLLTFMFHYLLLFFGHQKFPQLIFPPMVATGFRVTFTNLIIQRMANFLVGKVVVFLEQQQQEVYHRNKLCMLLVLEWMQTEHGK